MLLPSTGWSAEANEKERERDRENYRLKLGWKTFTTVFLEKHSVQIKQAPVCAECNDRLERSFPSLCLPFFSLSLFSFFFWYVMLSVILFVQNYLSILELSSPRSLLPRYVSPSPSVVMSLSRRESLGYQCSAGDRKRLINKLSCFSSPLYPPPFFLKRGLPLLPTTFLLIPQTPTLHPPHHPSFPSLLPCHGWQGVTGVWQ